jgi:hypothetical protein
VREVLWDVPYILLPDRDYPALIVAILVAEIRDAGRGASPALIPQSTRIRSIFVSDLRVNAGKHAGKYAEFVRELQVKRELRFAKDPSGLGLTLQHAQNDDEGHRVPGLDDRAISP